MYAAAFHNHVCTYLQIMHYTKPKQKGCTCEMKVSQLQVTALSNALEVDCSCCNKEKEIANEDIKVSIST